MRLAVPSDSLQSQISGTPPTTSGVEDAYGSTHSLYNHKSLTPLHNLNSFKMRTAALPITNLWHLFITSRVEDAYGSILRVFAIVNFQVMSPGIIEGRRQSFQVMSQEFVIPASRGLTAILRIIWRFGETV